VKFMLGSTFAVLSPDGAAIPVPVTDTLYEDLDREFDGFSGRYLVSQHSFEEDWPTWEIHPAGDEFVCLLSGAVELVLERDATREISTLEAPMSFVLVPRDTWHTARVKQPSSMLFITPGEGTLNRPL
jgi:hypothetical protein